MNDSQKIQPTHLARRACAYVRQSTETQVQCNRESTHRQYQLSARAEQLGWPRVQIKVIDDDLAQSGSGIVARQGFLKITQEVALGQVGLILCLEASRLARNNAEWYRLLDLCGVSDTLIGDADGLYRPGLFNDRLLLGLKGTMAEAELHVLRTRLDGGIKYKAKRGELRRGLPVGLVWGEADGEVRFHPDEAATGAIGNVFRKFTELGSARQVWLWFKSEGLQFPHATPRGQIQWLVPSYTGILNVLNNPAYAGAYAYGKSRCERYVDENGVLRKRMRQLPREQWLVLIKDHHPGFIHWATFEMNQDRLARNAPPAARQTAGALREAVNGRGLWCMRVGGVKIDQAVADAFLETIAPAGLEAAIEAQSLHHAEQQSALKQFGLQAEGVRYETQRAERRYQAVEPENRLVARTLEAEWENKLKELEAIEAQSARKEQEQRFELSDFQQQQILTLGTDLQQVWGASTTTDRDRKELLQSLLEDVAINLLDDGGKAHLVLRWKTGAVSQLEVQWKMPRVSPIRTAEDTIELIRRLAVHHPDAIIAGV